MYPIIGYEKKNSTCYYYISDKTDEKSRADAWTDEIISFDNSSDRFPFKEFISRIDFNFSSLESAFIHFRIWGFSDILRI